jgi:hypothetical protein
MRCEETFTPATENNRLAPHQWEKGDLIFIMSDGFLNLTAVDALRRHCFIPAGEQSTGFDLEVSHVGKGTSFTLSL